MIDKATIRQCLGDKRREIEQAELTERPFEFEPAANYVFVGVRHVGKSYMMYQRVRQLLREGTEWDEILFVNFEDERLMELQTEDLNRLLETHIERTGKAPTHIFLDEVQNVAGWDKFVRRLADAKYRVYVTGSNAKMLSRDVATTLGGRFLICDIYPFSFTEYLKAEGITLSKDWADSTQERSLVKHHFGEYLTYGGLPEIRQYKAKRAMLSSLYQKIYLGDICNRNSLRNERVLSLLIKKMAEAVCRPVSYNRLRGVVVSTGQQISIPTVIDYVGYAEDAWLLLPVGNELAKLSERESPRKYYFIDTGLLNLFLLNGEPALLENVVALQLCRTYGREAVSYYNADREIDFVVAERRLAIQVSWSISDSQTRERELAPLVQFGAKHPDWELMIITYEEDESDVTLEDGGRGVRVVPAWRWMAEG